VTDLIQGGSNFLVDELAGLDDWLAADRILDGFAADAPDDAGGQADDFFVTLVDGADNDTVDRTAIFGSDDDILGCVNELTGEVTGIGGFERRVGKSLTGTVGRDEVLEHGESLAEVRKNRALDDLAGRLGHQTSHAGKLLDLGTVASGTGIDHHEDRIGLRTTLIVLQGAEEGVGQLFSRVCPDILHLVLALTVGDDTAAVLLLNFRDLLLGTLHESGLLLRNDHVIDTDGSACAGGFAEAEFLELVQSLDSPSLTDCLVAAPDDVGELLLAGNLVVEPKFARPDLIEEHAANSRLDDGQFAIAIYCLNSAIGILKTDAGVDLDAGLGERELDFAGLGEERHASFGWKLSILARKNARVLRKVVATQRNVL